MKHFSEVYFPFKDQIIKEIMSMVVEASGGGKGGFFDMFNFFSFFGSSNKPESKMSEQEKARKAAREEMAKVQNERRKNLADKRDKLAAARIKKASELRKAQFNQKVRKELAKFDEEIATLNYEMEMIKKRGTTDIPFTKEELTRLTKQSLNPDTNIPDDQVLMNAHMRAVLFNSETGELRSNIVGEDGKINTEEFHKQLAKRAKDYPHLKKQLQKDGVLDRSGDVVEINWDNPGDNPTFKSLSEFVTKADADIASSQSKLQTARKTLETSQQKLDEINSKITTIEEQEGKKADYDKKLTELKTAKEKFEEAKSGANEITVQNSINEIKGMDLRDLSWGEINDPSSITDEDLKKKAERIQAKLKSFGIDSEKTLTTIRGAQTPDNLPDNIKEDLESKVEEKKSKIMEKAVKEFRDKAYEISENDDVLNIESAESMEGALKENGIISKITSDIKKEIENCDKAIDKVCEPAGENEPSMKFLKDGDLRKKKVKSLEESISEAETSVSELELANSPEEMMRIMKEEEETIIQMGELGNSDAYRDLKEEINIASKKDERAPGEIKKGGKLGYEDPTGKFIERPTKMEGDALDEYNNGLNASLAVGPKQESPEEEEKIKIKLDGEELKYYKVGADGKEVEASKDDYIKQQLDGELRARANAIRTEKLNKAKGLLNKLDVSGENDEDKAKAMEEAIKQLKPEEKAFLEAIASSNNQDEILKSAGIKSEDMDKYKGLLDESGLKKSSDENKSKDSENETGGSSNKEEFEDGFEIEGENGVKYIKKDGKYYMKDGDEEEEVPFDEWKKEVDNNTEGEASEGDEKTDDLEDEAEDEESKKRQDPAKVWKHGTYKRGNKTFKSKSYVNKKGDKISAKEYQKKVEAYKKSSGQSNESSSFVKANLLEHESLSYYLRSKLN